MSTGYGCQTAAACKQLAAMGHPMAVHAIFGLQGALQIWDKTIPLYPNNQGDWGMTEAKAYYDHFGADIYLTLLDIWVLGGQDTQMNWVPWVPVDHDPLPPKVKGTILSSPGIIQPIAMTRFAQQQMKNIGTESYYIPHTVDTTVYFPDKKLRQDVRESVKWDDMFVIGTVATNHAERKNYTAAMTAISKFSKMHPGEVIYYAHTDPLCPRGINLLALREALDLVPVMTFPRLADVSLGIPGPQMNRIYNSFDVFLLPSKGEGFGIPIIEAQACGVPVITTKCTGHEELLQGGGWFLEDLTPNWASYQNSFQFDCNPEEIVEKLEMAYQAKKSGAIKKQQKAALKTGRSYDETKIYKEVWPDVLADIEERIKAPRNMEGVQPWRLELIPRTCKPRKVLDVGCGMTQPYRIILERTGEYVGLDRAGGDGIIQADAENMPFNDGEFGFVWCSEVLEHSDNPQQIVNECKRVGKHGVIMFSTPQNRFFSMDPDHKPVTGVDYSVTQHGDGIVTW